MRIPRVSVNQRAIVEQKNRKTCTVMMTYILIVEKGNHDAPISTFLDIYISVGLIPGLSHCQNGCLMTRDISFIWLGVWGKEAT